MKYREFTDKAESLLVSADFRELKQAVTHDEPNIWRIAGMEQNEQAVSRFLAWLLNPKAGHSFGDAFLKQLVMNALRTKDDQDRRVHPVEILLLDLADAEVKVEHQFKNQRRCDVVISVPCVSGQPNSGFLCIIENKIRCKESPNQTVDYYASSFECFPEISYPNRVYLFLTPDGQPPQSDRFIPISYQDVLQALTNVEGSNRLTESEQFLTRQFRNNIRRGVAMDRKTVDLAKAIFEQHKDVLQVIWQAGNDEENVTAAVSQEWYQRSRFFNIGENPDSGYQWSDCNKYGFIVAGAGQQYRRIMEQMDIGETIYAYVSKHGFVGIGVVTKKAKPVRLASLAAGQAFMLTPMDGKYNASEDDDTCDWIVLVDWQLSVPKTYAVRQTPFTVSTSCKIYEHRQGEAESIKAELSLRSS